MEPMPEVKFLQPFKEIVCRLFIAAAFALLNPFMKNNGSP